MEYKDLERPITQKKPSVLKKHIKGEKKLILEFLYYHQSLLGAAIAKKSPIQPCIVFLMAFHCITIMVMLFTGVEYKYTSKYFFLICNKKLLRTVPCEVVAHFILKVFC